MDVSEFGSATELFDSGGSRNVAAARSQSFEDRIQSLDRLIGAANHHAIAAVDSPDPAAGAHVHVVDPLGLHP